jgi:hypothetical protein
MAIIDKQDRKIVIIESPFAGDVADNIAYARRCLRDSLLRGEAPFASHLLYTQPKVLDDDVPIERKLGIESGFAFKHIEGALTAFYIDRLWSSGMKEALMYCKRYGLAYTIRKLDEEYFEKIYRGGE